MDVQDAAGIGLDDAGTEHREEARQHHEVDVVFLQRLQQGGVERLAGGVVLPADDHALDACLGCALQRVDAGLGCHHQRDLAVRVLAPGLTVQQGLQIGAAAGH